MGWGLSVFVGLYFCEVESVSVSEEMIPMRKLLEKLLMRFRYRTMVRLHNHELRHCTLSCSSKIEVAVWFNILNFV